MPVITPTAAGGKNLTAFLDAIAACEGTAPLGDDGYNVMVGGSLFTSYASHPATVIFIQHLGVYSSAAGRYQLIMPTWQYCASVLGLTSFAPIDQDRAALLLVHEAKADPAVRAGDVATAAALCNRQWASLPGSPYGQPLRSLAFVVAAFTAAGGTMAST